MISLGFIAFVIAPVLLFAWILLKVENSRAARFLRRFPQPPRYPLIGSVPELLKNPKETSAMYCFEWPRKYGPRFGLQLGPRFHFISSSISDAEKILATSASMPKGPEFGFADWLGDSLLVTSGQKWFSRRKLLTPSFHFKILTNFLPVFYSHSSTLVELLREDTRGGQRITEVQISDYLIRFTLDTLCETAMGKRLDVQRVKDCPYAKATHGTTRQVFYRLLRPWLYPNFTWYRSKRGRIQKAYLDTLHGFTYSIMQERRVELQVERLNADTGNNNKSAAFKRGPIPFLDMLLRHQAEHPAELTDTEIREEVDVFMFAGHETTAMCLSWAVQLLGEHPEHQEKAYEELRVIFGDDKDRPVTTKDLAQMKYLECCIKETLRLYPSVPLLTRTISEDLILDDETTVPKGCIFYICVIQIHRDPQIYPDPEKFDPDRFSPENSAGRHPFAYLPFSGGQRNCIGMRFAMMEMKVVLATLLRNFRIKSLEKRANIPVVALGILRPRDGLRVRLVPRLNLPVRSPTPDDGGGT